MDSIVSVLQREDKNQSEVILYLEGAFYKAYGRSAYLFTQHVRPYRAKKYHYMKVNRDICSIGFPLTVMEDLEREGKFQLSRDGKMVTLKGEFPPLDEEEYRKWGEETPLEVVKPKRETVRTQVPNPQPVNPFAQPVVQQPVAQPLPVPVSPSSPVNTRPEEEVARRILKFAIESATPLECQNFLAGLKKILTE